MITPKLSYLGQPLKQLTDVYEKLRKELNSRVKFNDAVAGGSMKNDPRNIEMKKFARITKSLPNLKKSCW